MSDLSESSDAILHLYLTPTALRRMEQAIMDGYGRIETGGLLLGEYSPKCAIVDTVTVPTDNHGATMVGFVLDGEAHSAQADELIAEAERRIEIIGAWHTHICDLDFSKADHDALRILAETLGYAVSLLIVTAGSTRVYKAVFSANDHRAIPCKVMFSLDDNAKEDAYG